MADRIKSLYFCPELVKQIDGSLGIGFTNNSDADDGFGTLVSKITLDTQKDPVESKS